jgi:hypothetical protein
MNCIQPPNPLFQRAALRWLINANLGYLKGHNVQATVEQQIAIVEEYLRKAMLGSDVGALDELISPSLIFTNHFGQVIGKKEDLDAHRSGMLRLTKMDPSDLKIVARDQHAVVSVRMLVEGMFSGSPFSTVFRYTRVWSLVESNSWKIIAGHMSSVNE